jgi:hypothetical protein
VSFTGDYSEVADAQLDELEQGPEAELYDAVLAACELVFAASSVAQSYSAAVTTASGIVLRLPVAGHPPYKVFWTSAGPRVEAVFPHA